MSLITDNVEWVKLLNSLSSSSLHLLVKLIAERLTFLATLTGASKVAPPAGEVVGAASLSSITINQVFKNKVNVCFLQYCHRPNDFRRKSENLNFLSRSSIHLQFQWLIRPYLNNMKQLIDSLLLNLGLDLARVTYVPSKWQSTIIGAYGKGYEVRYDGVEVMQVTVFERFLGKVVEPILEITSGVERITYLLLSNLRNVPSYKVHDRYYYKVIYRYGKYNQHLVSSLKHLFSRYSWESMLLAVHKYNLFSANVNHNPIVRVWLHDLIRRRICRR